MALAATERGEATRRHILEAAALAFSQKGYAGTSLNELIRDTGSTKGGFYFHFPSKEALALAVFGYKQEQWVREVTVVVARHPRAIDQLEAMAAALCQLHRKDPSARCLSRLCTELGEDPQLAPRLIPQLTEWVELTASVIARAQDDGDARRDVDPRSCAEVAVAAFIGIETVSELLTRRADLDRRVGDFVALFLGAIRIDKED